MKNLKNWFPQAQAQFKAQAAEWEAQVKQKNLNPLPNSQIIALSKKINNLSTPSCYLNTIKSKLSEAIAKWQQEENATNSLVILGSPIERFAQIFNEALADWEQKDHLQIKSLSWSNRPPEHSTIKSQLNQEIGFVQEENPDNARQVVVIIPDLAWCFLRCVDGLETIEYLQELFFQDRSQFWLIGCNTWAWEYFDIVASFSRYFPQTLCLPELKDIDLKEWLAPVRQSIEFDFNYNQSQPNDHPELDEEKEDNWESTLQKDYFKHLANISMGLSHVASSLWLLSLGMEKEEDKSKDEDNQEGEDQEEKDTSDNIVLQKIALPDLPSLTKDDRYLLFSLCLHGQMTLSELAISLGEEQIKVQSQVQTLCNSGVVEHDNNQLKINPAYYLQIKRDLTGNNFLIEGDR